MSAAPLCAIAPTWPELVVVVILALLLLGAVIVLLYIAYADWRDNRHPAVQDSQEAQFAPLEPQGARSAAFPSGVGIWE